MKDCQSFPNPIEFDPNEPEILDDFEVEVIAKAEEADDEDFDEEDEENEGEENEGDKGKSKKSAKKEDPEDDEDFEEDDEEEEKGEKAPEKKKNNMSKLAQLACGFKPKINQILEQKVLGLVYAGIEEFRLKSRGARNEWMAIEFDLGYQF